ncbi:MAG: DUF6044 family protein [Lachnospiraceae bacterium]
MVGKYIQKLNQVKSVYFVIAGLLIVWIGYLPALLLGEGGVYICHDQLDGEIFSYILRAKHLFDDGNVYPELMNGIPKEGLQMAAPLLLLLFCVFTPLQAFLIGSMAIAAVGFAGMFLCIKEITGSKPLAFVLGGIFGYLPFYTVYGLSIMGLPLLLYAFMGGKAWEQEKHKNLLRVLAIVLYGLSSSLVLVGFAVLLFLGIAWIILIKKYGRKQRKKVLWFTIGLAVLGLTYLLCNGSLIAQVLGLGAGGFVSHKEEMIVYAVPMQNTIKELLLDGSMHARGLQRYMLLPIGIAVVWGACLYKKLDKEARRTYKLLVGFVLVNAGIILFSALYKSTAVVAWRNSIGGIAKYMQFDRVYWLMPAFWYFAFGAALYILGILIGERKQMLVILVSGMCIVVTGAYVLWNSSLKSNVRQLMNPKTSNAVTWEKFYSEELFAMVEEYIGRPKEEYRVLSLGVNPAVALYNGYYCLDGYSNNYDIEYKHQFRQIIEKEIADSEAIEQYFDTWGNRCYLFTSELGIQYSVNKNSGVKLQKFAMNTDCAKEMGCEYLLSGVEILNAGEAGLQFLSHFETESSQYEIWLYRLN